jgi:1-acyl-sn-glycerol-3-phosphate acyltransferase
VLVIVRSVVFNVLFYANLVAHLLLALPSLVLPRRVIVGLTKSWARMNLLLLQYICGIGAEFRGREKIPRGAVLVASKHQSLWETFALLLLFDDAAYILKRELMFIPFFGWCLGKADMIPVNRGRGGQALIDITVGARAALARGRQIIIFPEGTRTAPGAPPGYKYGVVHLYAETGAVCVPVALHSGLFWPRRSFRRFPGTVVAEVLDPIMPGLSKEAFAATVKQRIEDATARLIDEGERELAAHGIRGAAAAPPTPRAPL